MLRLHTDTVELAREDLQDNEGKAELTERGTNVRPLEGTLGGSDLNELRGS